MIGFKIGNYSVGGGRCLLIAEAGVNHNGSLELAKKLVDTACTAGADIVKFQIFKTENLITETVDMAPYQKENTKKQQTQFEMLRQLELTEKDFEELSEYCRKKGIMFLCTPFDLESVDVLERINVPAYKIASGEITNIQLIEKIAKTGKPIVISTGTATYDEIKDALDTARKSDKGCTGIALLHCVTDYPTKFEDLNLTVMKTLENTFNVPVGFSDHTEGLEASIAAAAMGAKIIEKHFTLDKNLSGPDHKASLEPAELATWVKSIRNVEKAIGDGRKKLSKREAEIKIYMRKSIIAIRDIKKGEVLATENVAIMRPETGILPKYWPEVIGKKAAREIKKFQPLKWDDIE